jgi:hypothetical protein
MCAVFFKMDKARYVYNTGGLLLLQSLVGLIPYRIGKNIEASRELAGFFFQNVLSESLWTKLH